MSIAVSAIVRPSRLLFLLVLSMSAIVLVIGCGFAFGAIRSDLPVLARFVLLMGCGFIAGFGFYHGIGLRKTIHIDISGTGQVRIREAIERGPCTGANRPHVGGSDEAVRLLSDSTLWPQLLLLRLQAESGKTTVLPVLPDCVSHDTFRALSAACRWIVTHRETGDTAHSGKNLETD